MAQTQPILIKQYGGRLYDTEAARYVTLDAIADLVRGPRPVVVQDEKTGTDVTSEMLAQIVRGDS
jgi:polyhydroxyalkanoate synthesis regulator protein